MTPEYLVKVGLIDKAPDASGDTGLLLQQALAKIAFLPFGLLVDQWRWQVFSGKVTPANYNQAWWALRLKYQGVAPPEARGEDVLRPGRQVPRARQHALRALLPRAHPAVPVSSRAVAGGRLHGAAASLLDLREQGRRRAAQQDDGDGAVTPWPEALEALTGSKQMDATAIIDYFTPLQAWLDQQVTGKPVGW